MPLCECEGVGWRIVVGWCGVVWCDDWVLGKTSGSGEDRMRGNGSKLLSGIGVGCGAGSVGPRYKIIINLKSSYENL